MIMENLLILDSKPYGAYTRLDAKCAIGTTRIRDANVITCLHTINRYVYFPDICSQKQRFEILNSMIRKCCILASFTLLVSNTFMVKF